MPKLSVIIPVYNAEKSVSSAIESVLSQTFKDIEIVIVNDGSTDSSGSVIKKYAESDSRIVYIDKEKNAGLSAARNSALEVITGEYFTFVDADDWIEANAYMTIVSRTDDADVVVYGFYHDTLDKDGNVSVSVGDSTGESGVFTEKKDIIEKVAQLDRNRTFAFTWNKLYRTDFVKSCNIQFENQTLIEDYMYNCRLFDKVTKLVFVDGCYYHYIKFSTEALTQKYLPDYFEIIDKRYELMKDMFVRNGLFDGDNRATLCSMHIKHIVSGMVKNCSEKSPLSVKEQKAVIKNLFEDDNCKEAVKYAKSSRKQELITNMVFATKSVFLNYTFAKVLYKLQNSDRNLFDRLK